MHYECRNCNYDVCVECEPVYDHQRKREREVYNDAPMESIRLELVRTRTQNDETLRLLAQLKTQNDELTRKLNQFEEFHRNRASEELREMALLRTMIRQAHDSIQDLKGPSVPTFTPAPTSAPAEASGVHVLSIK
jgi:hypothetical protein